MTDVVHIFFILILYNANVTFVYLLICMDNKWRDCPPSIFVVLRRCSKLDLTPVGNNLSWHNQETLLNVEPKLIHKISEYFTVILEILTIKLSLHVRYLLITFCTIFLLLLFITSTRFGPSCQPSSGSNN
jgi:hypothetical protein